MIRLMLISAAILLSACGPDPCAAPSPYEDLSKWTVLDSNRSHVEFEKVCGRAEHATLVMDSADAEISLVRKIYHQDAKVAVSLMAQPQPGLLGKVGPYVCQCAASINGEAGKRTAVCNNADVNPCAVEIRASASGSYGYKVQVYNVEVE